MAIGYTRTRNLMRQLDWKLRVNMDGENLISVEAYHPKRPTTYTVRKDSYRKLYPECRVIGQGATPNIAILGYDHDGTDETLI